MKRLSIICLIVLMSLSTIAWAADEIRTFTPSDVVVKTDTNGNSYVRFVVPVQKSKDGIAYEDQVLFMAFRETAQQAKAYKSGDTIRAIVKPRQYQGATNYTILKFLEPTQ